MHSRLTGEKGGYYVDFADGKGLGRALAEGFAYQGEPSEYFGRARGTASADLGGERFVLCLQNHDQVGNRAQGDRLSTIVPMAAVKMAAALLFAAPALPLLFMGEEYGETSPFQFFTSYLDHALDEAVRVGRAAEFTRFGWSSAPPDPGRSATFLRSRLNHSLAGAPRHRELREYYRRWLALRRSHPALGARGKERARCEIDAERQRSHAAPRGRRRRPGAAWSPTSPAPRGPTRRRRPTGATCSTARIRASPAAGWAGPWPPTRPSSTKSAGGCDSVLIRAHRPRRL